MPTPLALPAAEPIATSAFDAAPAAAAEAAATPAADASAAPPGFATGDTLLRMLRARGLVPDAARTEDLVRQMRDRASDVVVSAMNFIGVRYRRGGSDAETGFDCSGFTRHIFERTIGLVLPHRADDQARHAGLETIRIGELEPGDLVFFNTMRRAFSHVGIYIGDGKFIHSPRPGGEVRIEDMHDAYWAKRFTGARRVDFGVAAFDGARGARALGP